MFNFLLNHLLLVWLCLTLYALLILILTRKIIIPNFILRVFPNQNLRIVYFILYIEYKKAKDEVTISNFFKKDSKYSRNPNIYNNDAFSFWKEISDDYPEILLYYLDRSKLVLNDLKIIKPLVYQKEDPKRKNPIMLKMIKEKSSSWAQPDSGNRQNAARLGSIAIIKGLTGSLELDKKERMDLWSNSLGILKTNPFAVDDIFTSPFYTDNTRNFTPSAVYKNGIIIYNFFKEINYEDGMEYVKKELSGKDFKDLFRAYHFE